MYNVRWKIYALVQNLQKTYTNAVENVLRLAVGQKKFKQHEHK